MANSRNQREDITATSPERASRDMDEMTDMVTLITEPLQYPFMVRSIVAAVLVGMVCATVGTFVILRGMAFFGSAISHAILPGVAVGYLTSGSARGSLFWWALCTAIFTAVLMGWVKRCTPFKEDTTIGIIFAGLYALGIALITSIKGYRGDLIHFLFGYDVISAFPDDVIRTILFSVIVLFFILLFYKEFLVLTFDQTLAFTLRLPARALHYLLLILIAVTTVASFQTVGIAMVLAMLVTPPATAFLLCRHPHTMMAMGTGIGALSGVIGLYISFYAGISSGAAIVLVSMVFFIFSLLIYSTRPTMGRTM